MSLPIHLFNVTAISAVSMGADITSTSYNIDSATAVAVQWVYSGAGAETGDLIIQGSNDNSTFSTIDTTSITTDGNKMVNLSNPGYSWIRLFWDRTSGTGTLTATINAKRG